MSKPTLSSTGPAIDAGPAIVPGLARDAGSAIDAGSAGDLDAGSARDAGAASRPPWPSGQRSVAPGLLVAIAGGAVALSLGAYGRLHDPTGEAITTLGFSSSLSMKAWLTTVALVLGSAQALSAAWMWGRLPAAGSAPAWVAPVHRWAGTVAFLVSLPVAYHCLWSFGFQSGSPRVLAHSLLGCAFYGAMTTKLLSLRANRIPAWCVPLIGGILVTTLAGIWLTSSLWFFTTVAFPGL